LQVKVIQPTTVTAPQDTFVCEGESVQLFATGTTLYHWSPATGLSKTDVASPVARPLQTTVYTVTGKDPYNCFVTTDVVLVRYVPKPRVNAGKDTTVMAGYPFALKPSYSNDVSRVQWMPSLFLNCADCKFPRSTPSYSATYTLFAYTEEGCMSKDVVNVFVTCTKENLYIPNTFSPNGDGMNEVFYPRGRGIEKIKSMKIFSRWGQLLYEKTNFLANDVNAGWNGKKAGQLVTPDVYVYMIELVCENGNIITWKGDVTLVR
jgi:gliding motility-associated-like protein